MATIIDELIVRLGLDSSQFTTGVNKIGENLGAVHKHTKALDTAFIGLERRLLAVAAIFTGGMGLAQFANHLIQSTAALGRFSERLGDAPRDVAALEGAAQSFGATVGEMSQSLATINRGIWEGQIKGWSETLSRFIAMGKKMGQNLSLTDITGMTDKQKMEFIGRWVDMQKGAKEPIGKITAALQDLGLNLGTITFMLQDKSKRDAATKFFEALAPTPNQIRLSQEFIMVWAKIKGVTESVGRGVMEQMVGPIGSLYGALEKLFPQLKKLREMGQAGDSGGIAKWLVGPGSEISKFINDVQGLIRDIDSKITLLKRLHLLPEDTAKHPRHGPGHYRRRGSTGPWDLVRGSHYGSSGRPHDSAMGSDAYTGRPVQGMRGTPSGPAPYGREEEYAPEVLPGQGLEIEPEYAPELLPGLTKGSSHPIWGRRRRGIRREQGLEIEPDYAPEIMPGEAKQLSRFRSGARLYEDERGPTVEQLSRFKSGARLTDEVRSKEVEQLSRFKSGARLTDEVRSKEVEQLSRFKSGARLIDEVRPDGQSIWIEYFSKFNIIGKQIAGEMGARMNDLRGATGFGGGVGGGVGGGGGSPGYPPGQARRGILEGRGSRGGYPPGQARRGILGGRGQSPGAITTDRAAAYERIRSAAAAAGSPDPDMTAAIAMHESGWLSAGVYNSSGGTNPFGQTGVGPAGSVTGADKQPHKVYQNLQQGIEDHVKRWGKYYGKTPEETLKNLRQAGYNTVNPEWSGAIYGIYNRMHGGGGGGMDPMAPAGSATIGGRDTTTITTPHGRKLTVSKEFAANFQGFVNDYEAAGGVIGPESGGVSERPHNASYHPLGRAIDVNQVDRGVRSKTGKTLPQEVEDELAFKWGLYPGSRFKGGKGGDIGHFEVRNARLAHETLRKMQQAKEQKEKIRRAPDQTAFRSGSTPSLGSFGVKSYQQGGPVGPGGGVVEHGEYVIPKEQVDALQRAAHSRFRSGVTDTGLAAVQNRMYTFGTPEARAAGFPDEGAKTAYGQYWGAAKGGPGIAFAPEVSPLTMRGRETYFHELSHAGTSSLFKQNPGLYDRFPERDPVKNPNWMNFEEMRVRQELFNDLKGRATMLNKDLKKQRQDLATEATTYASKAGGETLNNLRQGMMLNKELRKMLDPRTSTGYYSHHSSAVSNNSSHETHIGSLNVHTQATDAHGIAHDLVPMLERSSFTNSYVFGPN